MISQMTISAALRTFILLEAASVASSTLTLTALQPTPLRWPVGDTIHLDYVLQVSADTMVTCYVDGRHVSEYTLLVPSDGVYQQARRSLLVQNASSRDAGLYECRATAGNVTRVLSWNLRQLAHTPCPPSHVCSERAGVSCPPCTCDEGNTFYGRNRKFRCRSSPWFVGLRFKKQPVVFHHLELPAIDYELTTFGDTQVLRFCEDVEGLRCRGGALLVVPEQSRYWMLFAHLTGGRQTDESEAHDTQVNLYLNGVLVHTHTVLVDSVETVVTFDETLVMPVPVDRYRIHDGVLEARLRGTNMRTQLTMQIQRVRPTKDMPCNASTEQLCRAVNTACTGTPMKCVCNVTTHFWYDQKTCLAKCNPPRQCAPMVAHSTCQSATSHSVCVCDSPRLHLDGMCVMPECLTELQCELKYGKNSLCQKGYCTCLAGHVLRDGRCSLVECLSNDECMDAHMHCVLGKCVCHSDYDLPKDDCRKGPVGQCPSNTPCAKENTECVRGRCYCKDGYRALHLEQGSPCLKITCDTNKNCSSIRGVCFHGRCSCPDLEPPATLTCLGRSLLSAAEVQTTLKLAVCTLGMVVGMIAFLAMSVMCMKSKEDYESTVDDDEAAEDQGALMAARKVLAAVQDADKDLEPPAEEGAPVILMRSLFPNLSRYFFGVHGDVGHISFGDTTVSDSSIDV